jgi:FMN phosphatase YigB (HAD superfamily)
VTFRAVLFDWRGTLVTSREPTWAVREAMSQVGRSVSDADACEVLASIVAANGVENRLDSPGMDADAAVHREIAMTVYRDAGLDEQLCSALYEIDADLRWNVFAEDAAPTLTTLRAQGISVGVISDIHFDIRPHFDAAGCSALVDTFTLSFEQGVQKPNPEMFTRTLTALGVDASEALMVGDRSGPDGAAIELGITTLLLPPLRGSDDLRLDRVLALAGASG